MEPATQTTDNETTAQTAHAMEGPWRIFWRRLRRQRVALAGAIILVILYTVMIFAGFISPYGFERQDRDRFFQRPTALRIAGWRFAVQGYAPEPGTSKFKAAPGDTAPLRFFAK